MRKSMSSLVLLAVLVGLVPVPSLAQDLARLEGLLIGLDGRAAVGHRVHLIDDAGATFARAETSTEGLYAFRDLPAGAYSLGIESPEGRMAPVAAPPVRLSQGALARRDVKLLQAGPSTLEAAGRENYAIGMWCAGLSTPAKIWTVVGGLAIVGITVAAVTDDDDEPASPN